MIDKKMIVPLTGLRGVIAGRMAESAATTARATLFSSVDAGTVLARRAETKKNGGAASVEDLVLSAVAHTLARHPSLNGILADNVITLRPSVDLGIAIALPNGLVAPAIASADRLNAEELSIARRDLVERARTNKLTVPEMTGASFTVSNLGHHRVDHFTPLINIPQIAILGLGCIAPRAVADKDGTVAVRPILSLSLSIDHRAVDGSPAAAFLTDLCDRIESTQGRDPTTSGH